MPDPENDVNAGALVTEVPEIDDGREADAEAGGETETEVEVDASDDAETETKIEVDESGDEKPSDDGDSDKGDDESSKPSANDTSWVDGLAPPDGTQIDDTEVGAVKAAALTLGLDKAQGEGAMQLVAEIVNQRAEAWNSQVEQWGDEFKGLDEFGGDTAKADAAIDEAVSALSHFFPREFIDEALRTGMINFPPLLQGLRKVNAFAKESGRAPKGGPRPVKQRRFANSPDLYEE